MGLRDVYDRIHAELERLEGRNDFQTTAVTQVAPVLGRDIAAQIDGGDAIAGQSAEGEPGRGDLGARAAERYVLARERRDEPTLATFAGEKAAFGLPLAYAEM